MTAEATGMLSQELYKKKPSRLTEEEKSTVSAFATLAGGIAGGLAGGSLSDGMNAAIAGKTTIENNTFGNKNEKPGEIYSINPLMPNALDGNGDPMVVGGKIGVKAPGKDSGKDAAGKSSGAENAATAPKLKGDLVQQNLNNIAKQDPRLAAVVQGDNGKLNYGIGLMSIDGTRVYRFPKEKPNAPASVNPTGTQANFETFQINSVTGQKTKIGDGHLNVIVGK